MRINYNQKQDTVYIRFSDEPYEESDEIKEGVILDYGSKGQIIGLEILDVSQKFSAKFLEALLKKRTTLKLISA